MIGQVAQGQLEIAGVDGRHGAGRLPGWARLDRALERVVVDAASVIEVVGRGAGDGRGPGRVAQDRDVADAGIGQGEQQGIAGRIVADLAHELDAEPPSDRPPGNVGRPAGSRRPTGRIARHGRRRADDHDHARSTDQAGPASVVRLGASSRMTSTGPIAAASSSATIRAGIADHHDRRPVGMDPGLGDRLDVGRVTASIRDR